MSPTRRTLREMRGLVFDLDGCVWTGDVLTPGAAQVLALIRQQGKSLCFLTNNSRARARTMQAKLVRLGVEAKEHEVLTPLEILGEVSTSASLAATPRRSSLTCMVRARARELLVRKHSPLPCRRIKASTSAAPGVSTSPVHTQPSRSNTKPCISRRARRGGLMGGGRILTRGSRARGTAAAPALSKLWVRGRSR
jgi:hypothetical protein